MSTALVKIDKRADALALDAELDTCIGNIVANRKRIAQIVKRYYDDDLWECPDRNSNGYMSFSDWVNARFSRCQSWGYKIKDFAELSTIVESEAEARECKGYDPLVIAAAAGDMKKKGLKGAMALRAALRENDLRASRDEEAEAAAHRNQSLPKSRDLMEVMETCSDQWWKKIKRFFSKETQTKVRPKLDSIMADLEAD